MDYIVACAAGIVEAKRNKDNAWHAIQAVETMTIYHCEKSRLPWLVKQSNDWDNRCRYDHFSLRKK
jgi:hypothetical protein